jgi:hypothetical protein
MSALQKIDFEKDNNVIKIHLEEYRSLMNEMLKRIEFQEKVLSYTILILGAFVTVLSSDWAKNNLNVLLLFSPMIFYSLGLVYAFNDYAIVNIARYVNKTLRPQLAKLLNNTSFLGFENYQYLQRKEFSKKFLGLISALLQSSFSVIAPILILGYFIFLHSDLCVLTKFELFTFLFDILFGIITVLIRIKFWNQNWESIVE